MSSQYIECVLCGYQYDPDQHLACQACPLHSNCNLVCCPACGYQTVNPRRSFLVRLASYLPMLKPSSNLASETKEGITLADVPPGSQAELVGFSDTFPADRKAYLQSYGLVLNHQVRVVQHKPVTIIRLDNIELALENSLAKGIMVLLLPAGRPNGTKFDSK
ncbi:MAG: FeoA family protein [Anaerolineales bacterium]|nr:ferrous iron transport protein A [Anaerolineales bacterium]